MASKGKPSKVEAEIEKCRSLQNWDKAIDITKTQLSRASGGLDVVSNLLLGEKELELYLRNNPPSEEHVEKACLELAQAEQCLRYVVQRASKEKENLKQEAVMLLGKLLFAQAKYKEALDEFDSINLDGLTLHAVTNRMLKIFAEGLAVKAMCMEKLLDKNDPELSRKEEMIIQYYEQAGDILFVHLQNRDGVDASSPTTPTTAVGISGGGITAMVQSEDAIGPILETAIQKSPLIYIERGQISKGVGRFRELLRAVEARNCKNLYRLTLARQLAEVLLRGVCSATYPHIQTKPEKVSKSSFKAKQYLSTNMFCPSNEEEEAILLLLIAEGMANKEAVLDRRPEHSQTRQHAFDTATSVYDLMAIALVRRANCSILCDSLERAMKFSYEEFHVWYQFALSLIETGKFERAYLVLAECHRLRPSDPAVLMLQARLCFEQLHMVDEGLEAALKVIGLSELNLVRSKAYVLIGRGYTYKMNDTRVRETREDYQQKALESFTLAYNQDRSSIEAVYHLGLHLATQRKIADAMKYTREALKLQRDHLHSLTLLSLLLSSEKAYEKALEVIKIALSEHPDTMSLLLVKSKLENVLGLYKQSLATCAQMLRLWKTEHMSSIHDEEERGTGLLDKFTSNDNRGLYLAAATAQEAGSIRESIAASRVEKALSDVASSSPSSIWVRPGPQHSWSLQARIWLHLAELYMDNGLYHDAHACVQEALAILPLSHLASYMKGRVMECEMNYAEAKNCYETALTINPYHAKSLTHLGRTLLAMGDPKMAEKTLREAVNSDPTSHHAWKELGVVLKSFGEQDTACECLMTAIDLESSAPILPFGILLQMA